MNGEDNPEDTEIGRTERKQLSEGADIAFGDRGTWMPGVSGKADRNLSAWLSGNGLLYI